MHDLFKMRGLMSKLEGSVKQSVESDQGLKRLVRPVYNHLTQAPRYDGKPATIAFNYPGLNLTHRDIECAVYERL